MWPGAEGVVLTVWRVEAVRNEVRVLVYRLERERPKKKLGQKEETEVKIGKYKVSYISIK